MNKTVTYEYLGFIVTLKKDGDDYINITILDPTITGWKEVSWRKGWYFAAYRARWICEDCLDDEMFS